MSRPTQLTPRARDRFLQAIAAGVFPEVAARHAGFSPASYYRYMTGATPEHLEFRDAVIDALAALEVRLSATLAKRAMEDPKWALTLLELRFPERWRSRSVDASRRDEGAPIDPQESAEIIVIEPGLIDAIVPKLLEAGRRERSEAETETADERVDRFQHRTPPRALPREER